MGAGKKKGLLLFSNQLYSPDYLPQVDVIFVVEDQSLFGTDPAAPKNLHKQKILFMRASTRRYVEEMLWPRGFKVEYLELSPKRDLAKTVTRINEADVSELFVFDPLDAGILDTLNAVTTERSWMSLHVLESPNFLLSRVHIKQYLDENGDMKFAPFYRWMRERKKILLNEAGGPMGGAWTYEETTRAKLDEANPPAGIRSFGDDAFTNLAYKLVEEQFADNFGNSDGFIWATNHHEASMWLHDFLDKRLEHYREYRNTLHPDFPFLYHSALSVYLNSGLLQPDQVLKIVMERHEREPIPIKLLETFVRDVIGWREYCHMIYLCGRNKLLTTNTWQHKRALSEVWFTGQTGIAPFDMLVQKISNHAYATNVERRDIAGMLLFLSEISPDEAHRFFSELFIDAYEWVTIPNVYGISQCVDGGTLVDLLPIATSSFLTDTGLYPKGDWVEVWDALYWRFLDKHKTMLAKNPYMKQQLKKLEEMDPDRKRIYGYRADDFLTATTIEG